MSLDRLNILLRLSIESGIAKQINLDVEIRIFAKKRHVRPHFNEINQVLFLIYVYEILHKA